MLRLILGISGTGKTGRVLAEMKVRAAARRRSILLVPEQFSSSAETMVYRSLGDAFSACAEVYSFTSFAELVLKTFGGAAVKTLTDAARAVAVRRAMDTLGDELQAYRRHRRSTGFCSMCADAIKELKTAGASPETLLDVARTAGEDGGKLHETENLLGLQRNRRQSARPRLERLDSYNRSDLHCEGRKDSQLQA